MKPASALWLDQAGNAHWDIPTFLAEIGLPDTPENRELAIREISAITKGVNALLSVVLRKDEHDRRFDVLIDENGRPTPESN